jgi:uncharacterized protein (TIGR00297 family)
MESFLLGTVLAAIIVLLANRFGWLTQSAAIGAFILGVLVFGFYGLKWSTPILVFFFSSVLLTRYGHERKQRFGNISDLRPRRRFSQLLANGGMAGLMVLIYFFFTEEKWYLIYGAAVASMTSDMWSTEIGMMSRRRPRNIYNRLEVDPGSSGGLTIAGIVAGIVACFCIFLSMTPWLGFHSLYFYIICASGLSANLFDSLLGATLQVQYRCPRCQAVTERSRHCDNIPTEYHKGVRFLTTDSVNFFASVFGTGSALLLLSVLG